MNKLEAGLVFEKHPIADEKHGPGEYGKVGFRINEKVFWVDGYYFPHTSNDAHGRAVEFATEIVIALNRGFNTKPYSAPVEKLRSERK